MNGHKYRERCVCSYLVRYSALHHLTIPLTQGVLLMIFIRMDEDWLLKLLGLWLPGIRLSPKRTGHRWRHLSNPAKLPDGILDRRNQPSRDWKILGPEDQKKPQSHERLSLLKALVLLVCYVCHTAGFHPHFCSVLIVLFLLVIGIPAARMTVGLVACWVIFLG